MMINRLLTLVAILGMVAVVVLATREPTASAHDTTETQVQTDALPFLTNDESNNIAVFKSAGPSVVFVTNKQLKKHDQKCGYDYRNNGSQWRKI